MKNEPAVLEDKTYQICTRCIMDTSYKGITFTNEGVCHHCLEYDEKMSTRLFEGQEAKDQLSKMVETIKAKGKGNDYDCIIGVSGGVDSTYVAYLTKQLGLRPLAIHFDNGWNSELAVSNIEKALKKLDVDLYTYVVNWQEFRDLQVSFLKGSTPDGEIPTDHGIFGLMWGEASRRNIKYIISGMNFKSESMNFINWAYGHSDWKYIKDVHAKFGSQKLKTFPHFSFFDLFKYNVVKGIRWFSILNYIDYDKDEAMKVLKEDLGWQSYGGKHHESLYTRYYQGVFLPQKFNIDKRRAHLSDLIKSDQISREEALIEIEKEPYPVQLQKEDREFVIKKLKLNEESFEAIMNAPIKSYKDYKNSQGFVEFLKSTVHKLRKVGLYPK